MVAYAGQGHSPLIRYCRIGGGRGWCFGAMSTQTHVAGNLIQGPIGPIEPLLWDRMLSDMQLLLSPDSYVESSGQTGGAWW